MSDGGAVRSRSTAAAASTPPRRRRRWLRRLGIACAVLLAFVVVVRLLLPTAIEHGAGWAGPRYLGLPIRIANVDLALFSGAVTIEGLAIGSRADAVLPEPVPIVPAPELPEESASDPASAEAAAEPSVPSIALEDPEPEAPEQRELLLSWQRVHVRLDYGALFDRTLRVHALEIDAPDVRLERQSDGRIDPLADARPTAAPAEDEPPEPEEPPGEPWAVVVETLALRGPAVRIVDDEAELVLLDFGLEDLTLEAIEMRGADLSLGSVGIDGPVLRVRRDFVFRESGAPPPPDDPPDAPRDAPESPGDEPSPSYRVERIAIDGAHFVWITEAGPLNVALTFEAEGVTAAEGERFPLALTLEIGSGRFVADGQVGILPPSYQGQIAWQRLPIPPLLLAALPEFAPWLQSAQSTADLQLSLRLAETDAGPPELRLSGPISLEALELGDPEEQEVALGWKALDVAIRDVRVPFADAGAAPAATQVELEHVRLVEPDVSYTPPTPALDALLGRAPSPAANDPAPESAAAEPGAAAPEAAEPEGADPEAGDAEAVEAEPEPAPSEAADSEPSPAPAPAPSAPLEVDVDTVELVNGRLRFEDRSGPGGPLSGTIEGLDVVGDALAVRMLDGTTTVTLGSLTLANGELRFADARGAQPQSGGIDGLQVALGDLTLTSGTDAVTVALESFGLDAQSIQFEDQRVDPVYRGRFRDLVVRAEGLRFPERVARSLRATGASADGGGFELTGSLDGDTGEATLELNGLALAPFNPYATQAAGYRIAGDASLKTTLRMRGARYDARNRIVLGKLAVSSQEPGDFEKRFGVPLDLALALLRDPTGNISLSIPVSVDETGTRTGVATIVAGALRQALIGAITSPLKMLGSAASGIGGLFQGDGAGIEPIRVAPGEADPETGQADRYEGLVKLLSERPELALRLRGRTGPEDRPRVAEQMLIERIEAGDGLPDLEDGAGFLQRRRLTGALEARGRGDADELDGEDEAMLERYIAAVQVPEERLTALARARAEAVREIAVTEYGVPPTHLTVADAAPPGPPGVLLELTPAP